MLDGARAFFWAQLRAVKPAFVSKTPHFNFISVHYTIIIGATLLASIIIYASSTSTVPYIDALLFASGANTQAGLNPDDLNKITTFQQVVIYLFTMLSNPITLHSSVVFLRLYWFEKRFQGVVKDARQRRGTLSKSKSRARNEDRSAEEGVNGRDITMVPTRGRPPRITNDGILLDGNEISHSQAVVDDDDYPPAKTEMHTSSESDTATVSNGRSNSMDLGPLDVPEQAHDDRHMDQGANAQNLQVGLPTPTAISFADTVKRSDGVDDDLTKFPQRLPHSEHIAILQRQRDQDTENEILRIPNPRDAEKGMGPRRVEDGEEGEDDDRITMIRSNIERPQVQSPRERRPTIVIAEPERPTRDDATDDAKTIGGASTNFRLRKPRTFSRGHRSVLEDDESGRPVSAFRARTVDTIRTVLARDSHNDAPYLSYTPTMGRNSNFLDLTTEQREELGGIEYRSLRTLAVILICYFWGFHFISATCLCAFIKHNEHYGAIVDEASVGRLWWGIFTSNSVFMDLGFTLTPDSMNSFNTSEYIMMTTWFFIIIGNTGFPVMLRFIIWALSKLVPRRSGLWEELRFLLDHPRRCFTLLFPSSANWWLFWILVGLNIIDLLFFMVLDLHSSTVSDLPVHTRIADGLFQAAATRTAGFSCFSMSALHPAMPVLYMIMMYISIFPIAISIRRTNVYEEKSLGVYHDKNEYEQTGSMEATALSYVSTHLRRQLSFDLWYVFVGFFFLAISEGHKLKEGEFDLFAILFEVISAYGTVGLSMGGTGYNAALCSQFTVVGKLIIVAMQIRGRHRGLPYGLDRAVLLPSEARFEKEAEIDQPILVPSQTVASTSGTDYPGSISGRRRSVSRGGERERTNSHIITQFLYPGPVIRNDAIHGHRRSASATSRDFPRAFSEPVGSEEKDELGPLRPIESHGVRPRKAAENSAMP